MRIVTVFELPRTETPGKFSFQEINYGEPIAINTISASFYEELTKKPTRNYFRPAPIKQTTNPSLYQKPKVRF